MDSKTMSAKTMSKKPKPKRDYDNTQRQANNVAGPCVMCPALLKVATPPREQKTRVYSERGEVRYCICDNCGHTWKKVPKKDSA
jgi:hypothetical protein